MHHMQKPESSSLPLVAVGAVSLLPCRPSLNVK
jgi:hypothetical protein